MSEKISKSELKDLAAQYIDIQERGARSAAIGQADPRCRKCEITARPGYALCDHHHQESLLYSRKRRAQKRAAGVCVRCSMPTQLGRARCPPHHEEDLVANKVRRALQRASARISAPKAPRAEPKRIESRAEKRARHQELVSVLLRDAVALYGFDASVILRTQRGVPKKGDERWGAIEARAYLVQRCLAAGVQQSTLHTVTGLRPAVIAKDATRPLSSRAIVATLDSSFGGEE